MLLKITDLIQILIIRLETCRKEFFRKIYYSVQLLMYCDFCSDNLTYSEREMISNHDIL